MGLIDKLRKAGGIFKNRLASSTGALRRQLGRVTVRVPRRVRGLAVGGLRAARLTSPLGLGLTAAAFTPQILRGLRAARGVVARGVAFVGGKQVVSAGAAGGVAGLLLRRGEGAIERQERLRKKRARARRKKAKPRKVRRRIPAHRHKVISVPVRRRKKARTHRSPRHKGHKRVSFTTKEGKKVSFLSNPKAKHR